MSGVKDVSNSISHRSPEHAQAAWMLASVNTPWDQSETLRTAWTLQVPYRWRFGLLAPRSRSPPGFALGPCQYCLYLCPISHHRWKWGWPRRSLKGINCRKGVTYGRLLHLVHNRGHGVERAKCKCFIPNQSHWRRSHMNRVAAHLSFRYWRRHKVQNIM